MTVLVLFAAPPLPPPPPIDWATMPCAWMPDVATVNDVLSTLTEPPAPPPPAVPPTTALLLLAPPPSPPPPPIACARMPNADSPAVVIEPSVCTTETVPPLAARAPFPPSEVMMPLPLAPAAPPPPPIACARMPCDHVPAVWIEP